MPRKSSKHSQTQKTLFPLYESANIPKLPDYDLFKSSDNPPLPKIPIKKPRNRFIPQRIKVTSDQLPQHHCEWRLDTSFIASLAELQRAIGIKGFNFEGLVLDPQQINFVYSFINSDRFAALSAPTNSGKTLMALMISAKVIDEGKSVIFIAPDLTLVDQVVGEVHQRLPAYVDCLKIITHITKVKEREPLLTTKTPSIIVATPEITYNLSKNNPERLNSIGLVIIDEAHRIRGRSSYAKLVGLLKEINLPRLLLSGTYARNNEDAIKREQIAGIGREQVYGFPLIETNKLLIDHKVGLDPESIVIQKVLRTLRLKEASSAIQNLKKVDDDLAELYSKFALTVKTKELKNVSRKEENRVRNVIESEIKNWIEKYPFDRELKNKSLEARFAIYRYSHLLLLEEYLTAYGKFSFLNEALGGVWNRRYGASKQDFSWKWKRQVYNQELLTAFNQLSVSSKGIYHHIAEHRISELLLREKANFRCTSVSQLDAFRSAAREVLIESEYIDHSKELKLFDLLQFNADKNSGIYIFTRGVAHTLFLVERVKKHANLENLNPKPLVGSQSLNTKARQQNLKDFIELESKMLIGTVLAEGHNNPRVKLAVVYNPPRTPEEMEQIQGRLGRGRKLHYSIQPELRYFLSEGNEETIFYAVRRNQIKMEKFLRSLAEEAVAEINYEDLPF